MMGKLLALILVLALPVGGAFLGDTLRPPEPEGEGQDADAAEAKPEAPTPAEADTPPQILTFRQPFTVPLMRRGDVSGFVVLTLGVSASGTPAETIRGSEPILRDGLLEALFQHASLGGFEQLTDTLAMNRLRIRLNDVVEQALQDDTARILIVSAARQAG